MVSPSFSSFCLQKCILLLRSLMRPLVLKVHLPLVPKKDCKNFLRPHQVLCLAFHITYEIHFEIDYKAFSIQKGRIHLHFTILQHYHKPSFWILHQNQIVSLRFSKIFIDQRYQGSFPKNLENFQIILKLTFRIMFPNHQHDLSFWRHNLNIQIFYIYYHPKLLI